MEEKKIENNTIPTDPICQTEPMFDRCPNCCRKTVNGKEDYISLKNGKITKTCIKCRTSVKKSLIKAKEGKKPNLKNRECIEELMSILKRTDCELNEEEQERFLKVLDKFSTN